MKSHFPVWAYTLICVVSWMEVIGARSSQDSEFTRSVTTNDKNGFARKRRDSLMDSRNVKESEIVSDSQEYPNSFNSKNYGADFLKRQNDNVEPVSEEFAYLHNTQLDTMGSNRDNNDKSSHDYEEVPITSEDSQQLHSQISHQTVYNAKDRLVDVRDHKSEKPTDMPHTTNGTNNNTQIHKCPGFVDFWNGLKAVGNDLTAATNFGEGIEALFVTPFLKMKNSVDDCFKKLFPYLAKKGHSDNHESSS